MAGRMSVWMCVWSFFIYFFIFCLFAFYILGGIFVFGERWLTFHVGMVYLYMGLMIESVTL
jgi:hypothetical protein